MPRGSVEWSVLDRHAVLGKQNDGSLLAHAAAHQKPEGSGSGVRGRIEVERLNKPIRLALVTSSA